MFSIESADDRLIISAGNHSKAARLTSELCQSLLASNAFVLVKQVFFPEPETADRSQEAMGQNSNPNFKQRFADYVADHYRVRMRPECLSTPELREDFKSLEPMIEIQVASVLMHAWAEVNHDLICKTLTGGAASDEEHRLLDATNGLVQSGEVLLQQLQIAVETRVSDQNEQFSDQYDLGSFLRGKMKLGKLSMDQLDILFQILKVCELDSPVQLPKALKGWDIDNNKTVNNGRPIALRILDHILGSMRDGLLRAAVTLNPRPFNRGHWSLPARLTDKIIFCHGSHCKGHRITMLHLRPSYWGGRRNVLPERVHVRA